MWKERWTERLSGPGGWGWAYGWRKGPAREKRDSGHKVLCSAPAPQQYRCTACCGRNQGVCVSQNFKILGKSFPSWRADPPMRGRGHLAQLERFPL